MRIAIPMADDAFCEHFGGASGFAIFDGNPGTGLVGDKSLFTPPEHKPGSLPRWLEEQNVDAVVASAIGERALFMLADAGIVVFLANGAKEPSRLATAALAGRLLRANRGNSRCEGDHHDHDGHDCHHH